jgi:hypothetical protein
MSYTITTTAGATLATIADGTVNSTNTSLTLIGKNYAGYGIFLNENYIKLLENFYNSSAPTAPLAGQLWYDSTNSLLKVYNGSLWKPISSSASGSTQPSSPVTGDLWYDSANAQLKVWSGSTWVTVGPSYTTTSGTSGAVVETVLEGATPHVIVKFYISNTVVAILSKDATFTPSTGISGFTTIVPGFNLSTTIAGAYFTGTVSSAATLQGVAASGFLRSDQASSTIYTLGTGALTVASDLTIASSSGDVNFTNGTSNKDMNLYVKIGSTNTKALGIAGTTGKITTSNDFQVAGATTLTGAATFSSTLALNGVTTISAQVLPNTTSTIELGSSSKLFANVWATTLRGTAITANYADLAERFEADTFYAPGTVVALGGAKEITAANQDLSDSVFGVISTRAGFLMNGAAGEDATHPPVAVNGRVPVNVTGIVRKGDRLVSAGRGFARAASRSEITAFNVIGRSLEDKNTTVDGIVEAIVKINS